MKCRIDLTSCENVDNYSIIMGNRVIFKSPNLEFSVEDGGKNSDYTLENNGNHDLNFIYQSFIESFIISNDSDFKKKYLSDHSLEKSIESGEVVVIGDKSKFDTTMSKLRDFEKTESNFLSLLQGLYTYMSNKKININVSDIHIKHENNGIILIFSKYDMFNDRERVEYNIGDTTAKFYWKESGKESESMVNDDISLYISKVKFKEVEKELNELFQFSEPVVFNQPDLSNIAQEISEFNALIRSFLTVGVRNDNFENAEAFRYTFDNGVLVNFNEKIRVFIGREFGMITLSNEETKGSRVISISDERSWKNLNMPELSDPLIAIHYMANELNHSKLIKNNILLDHIENLEKYVTRKLNLENEFSGNYLLTFSKINETEFMFKLSFNDTHYIKVIYNGLLKMEYYINDELNEGIYINNTIMNNANNTINNKYNNIDSVKIFSEKTENFRKYLNMLNKYI